MDSVILQVFYSILSGVIQSISISNEFLPFGSPLLAAISLIPLYLAIYNAKTYKRSFLLFFIQTLTVHLISSFWLANFHGYAIFTLGASAFGTAFVIGGCMGIIMHMYPHSVKLNDNLKISNGLDFYGPFKRSLWFAALFVTWEYVKSVGDMGYPWGTISMACYRAKVFTQIADVTGVWGISFIFILSSCFFAEFIMYSGYKNPEYSGRQISHIIDLGKFTLVVFLVCGIYGGIKLLFPKTPEKYINTIIVQQNCDPWKASESDSIEISKRLTREVLDIMEEQEIKPDLVLWSEGVLSRPFPRGRTWYETHPAPESLREFIKETNCPFLIGGSSLVDQDKRKYSNAAVLFDSDGVYSGFYNKIHLVPFAEVIPYAENPLMQAFMKKLVGLSSGWTPGQQFVLFKVPLKENMNKATPLFYGRNKYTEIELNSRGKSNRDKTREYIENKTETPLSYVKFSAPICFEDSFNDVCRTLHNMGSEIFMNITNDSWSKTDSAEFQHFIAASYRTIEYRTTMVRCANSGYSVVIDCNGKILAHIPTFEEKAIWYRVPVYPHSNTIYARYGDWFAKTILFAVFIYSLYVLYGIYLKGKIKHPKHKIITIRFVVEKTAGEKTSESILEKTSADSTAEAALRNNTADAIADTPAVKQEKDIPKVKTKSSAKTPAKKTPSPAKTVENKKTAAASKKDTVKTAKAKSAATKSAATKSAATKKTKAETAKKTSTKNGKDTTAKAKTTAKKGKQ